MTAIASRVVHARASFKPPTARPGRAARARGGAAPGGRAGGRGELRIARRAEQSGGERRVSSEDAVAESAAPEGEQPPVPDTAAPKDLGAQIQELKNKGSGGAGGMPKEAENPFVGAFEEIGQTEWPSPISALQTTGIVIAIVMGSTFVLLTVNSALSAVSQAVFK